MRQEAAAQRAGADRQTLRAWVIRNNEHGLDGLADQPRDGRPPKLGAEKKAEPIRLVLDGPAPEVSGLSIRARVALPQRALPLAPAAWTTTRQWSMAHARPGGVSRRRSAASNRLPRGSRRSRLSVDGMICQASAYRHVHPHRRHSGRSSWLRLVAIIGRPSVGGPIREHRGAI
jgi:hypothetical protein